MVINVDAGVLANSVWSWSKGFYVPTDDAHVQLWPQHTKLAFSAQTRSYLETQFETHPHTRAHLHAQGASFFQLFDYFVDAVIVRPPLISSIYSQAMPEGYLGKFLQSLSIYQDGRQTRVES